MFYLSLAYPCFQKNVRVWLSEKVPVPEEWVPKSSLSKIVEVIDIGSVQIKAGSDVADIKKRNSGDVVRVICVEAGK